MITHPIAVLAVIAIAAALIGCASPARVVTSHISIAAGTNTITVEQPKDTVIKKLEFDPATGRLTLEGYSSTGNAAAIAATEAQIQAQAQAAQSGMAVAGTALQAVNSLAAVYAKSQGLPPVPAGSPPKAVVDRSPVD
jgi:hypothetical protein